MTSGTNQAVVIRAPGCEPPWCSVRGPPRMYSRPRASRAARVVVLIMPRSATTHTRLMPKRWRRRSTTGIRAVTSVVLPGHISQHNGRPCWSITTATIICIRSGRWSLEWPRWPRVSPPAPSKYKLVVSMKTTDSSLNRSRRGFEQPLLHHILAGSAGRTACGPSARRPATPRRASPSLGRDDGARAPRCPRSGSSRARPRRTGRSPRP